MWIFILSKKKQTLLQRIHLLADTVRILLLHHHVLNNAKQCNGIFNFHLSVKSPCHIAGKKAVDFIAKR